MNQVIKVENLSKAYQLGSFGTGTISRDIERYLARLRGKEDPFLKIGEVNDRTKKSDSNIVWSLKDINFSVDQGDAVGIIGRNGAGKSTLLKIMSRITSPTAGSVKVKGRIASLLEVGTGFHPELNGRENIFLNGAILGMRKIEIKRRFDEIVNFAGIDRYIDTPVKRYSSGMYVRLAFAVAAHLESEILIVDEVLSVGDAEFQKKCLGKMSDVSKGEGRTVLFVSHNMDAVKTLCNKGIILNNGLLVQNSGMADAIKHYTNTENAGQLVNSISNLSLNTQVTLQLFQIDTTVLTSHQDLGFVIKFNSAQINHFDAAAILIYDETDQKVAFIDLRCNELNKQSSTSENFEIAGYLKNLQLLPGLYSLGIHVQSNMLYKDFFNLLRFEVVQKKLSSGNPPYDLSVRGKMEIDYHFSIS